MTEGPSEDMHSFVLRNYFRQLFIMTGFHEIDFFTFGIISVNFLPLGIISVGFHEINFFTFGIISVNF
jgi:hypothetical protein